MTQSRIKPDWGSIPIGSAIPFIGIHIAAIACAVLVRPTPAALLAAAICYVTRTMAITGGYHRYFAHRGYKTTRAFQFVIALLGTLALQKGPLWWAAHHRVHHRFSDTERDIHSARIYGFWWAYCGWILSSKNDPTDSALIGDFWRYPELRFLDRYYLIPPLTAGVLVWFAFGPTVFVWAGLVATVVQWHAMFSSNVFCHIFGSRRFETSEDSRNNPLFAIIVLGEGWHNNHHYYPASARQGFYWWEIDFTYCALLLLEKCGLVSDLQGVPARVLAAAKSPTLLRANGRT